ncbi:MAG: hypothetical protein HFF11_06580 [Angelakisella sp.]|jgi:hypothetical protein|nr:hypothetical protein [Angelakisella sp.]
MNYRQSNRLEGIALAVGLIMEGIGILVQQELLLLFGGIIALAGIFQTKFFCRCPNCKKPLDTRNGMPRCCPACGIRLEGY